MYPRAIKVLPGLARSEAQLGDVQRLLIGSAKGGTMGWATQWGWRELQRRWRVQARKMVGFLSKTRDMK